MKNFKKLTAPILAILLLIQLASPLALAQPNEFHIRSEKDWTQLVKNCRMDSWSDSVTVILDVDLDLPEDASIPTFGGHFNGNGHILRSLHLISEGDHQGLFRYIRAGAVVENLTVTGTVAPEGKSAYVGGIAGSNEGTLRSCRFLGAVSGSNSVGGLVGINEATGRIEHCEMDSGAVSGDHYTGGVVGDNRGTVISCGNRAQVNTKATEPVTDLGDIDWTRLNRTENVSAATDTGGIAGYSGGLLQSCINFGLVGYPHLGYNVGGIAGRQMGLLSDCTNNGAIRGRKDVGGIVGQAEPFTELRYQEDTLQKLGRNLDRLSSILNGVVNETSASRKLLSAHVDNLSSYTGDAQTHTETILDELGKQTDETVDTFNDLSHRIGDILDDAHPVSQQVANAFDNLEDASDDLRSALDALKPSPGEETDFHNALSKSMTNLQTAMEAYAEAKLYQKLHPDDEDSQQAVLDAQERLGQSLTPLEAQAKYWTGKISTPMDDALGNMGNAASSMEAAFTDLTTLIDHQRELPDLELPNISPELRESEDLLGETLDSIRAELDSMNDTAGTAGDTLDSGLHRINNQFSNIANVLRNAENDIPDKLVVDVTDESLEKLSTGRLQDCRNLGSVDGDVSVGGICGAMAIEYDFDPEDDTKETGNQSLTFQYLTRAAMVSCINRGAITSRKNGVGGIVGSMDLGVVSKAQNYGTIESTNGEQVGGIAGSSKSVIRDSWAKCSLSGQRSIGGIAGSGTDIRNCRSLVEITDGASKLGAIAGESDGDLAGNFFLSENLGGVDGISYAGKAAPLTWEKFTALDGIPTEFQQIRVRFLADDSLVKTLTVPHGTSISPEEIPPIPEEACCLGRWENFDLSHAGYDLTVKAVYIPWLTTLSSGDGSILAEGTFEPEAHLGARKINAELEGQEVLFTWEVRLGETERNFSALRVKLPEDAKHVILYARSGTDADWTELECTQDGSYLRGVWEARGGQLALVQKQSPVELIVLAGSCIFLLLAYVILRHRDRKKK